MNLNELAKCVSEKEGLKEQISIAQIKEVIRIIDDITCGLFKVIVKWLKKGEGK